MLISLNKISSKINNNNVHLSDLSDDETTELIAFPLSRVVLIANHFFHETEDSNCKKANHGAAAPFESEKLMVATAKYGKACEYRVCYSRLMFSLRRNRSKTVRRKRKQKISL